MLTIVDHLACLKAREQAGFASPEEVAQASGLNLRLIKRLERGDRVTAQRRLVAELARVYGCPVEAIEYQLPPKQRYTINSSVLQQARKARRWSIDDLATNAAIAYDTVQRWESSRPGNTLDVNCLLAVAQALDLPWQTLLQPHVLGSFEHESLGIPEAQSTPPVTKQERV